MRLHRAAPTLVISIAVLVAGPAAAQAKTETVTEGAVTASLSYTANKAQTRFKDLKLEIKRGGATVLTSTLPRYKDFWPGALGEGRSIRLHELDGDRDPEVVVDLFSGGANCCLTTLIYRYRAKGDTYVPLSLRLGRYGYSLRNLDRKGPVEIVATDVRLAGAFGVPTVAAVAPIRIFQLDRDGLTDATRAFPTEVRKDLRVLRREYRRFVRQKAPRKGILAALAADYITLNDERGAARTLRRVDVLYGREFGKRLRSFLARRGYRLR